MRVGEAALKQQGREEAPRGRRLFTLCLAALGIVYGDIGTSPLYALRECFVGKHAVPPTPENVLGILSLIFWSLTIVVTIKYLVYVLRLDNRGEGGILALMSLVQAGRRRGTGSRWLLIGLGVFGAALLYGDGIITPAISVLSAVEGLEVAAKTFHPYVIPLTIIILFFLFWFQRRGTAGIGSVFGPIMLVWFSTIALLGVSGILREPSVLAAANPIHGVRFFAANGWHGFLVLGTVFLVATGGEALYADLGHFGKRPIRIDWFSMVGVALVANYFGQGALLIHDPRAASNPFYLLGPDWALYPLIGLATVATIIASQAIITGAFSLTRQAVNLGYLPRMEIRHTSPTEIGQIYIPAVNRLLAISTIGLVLGFRSSTNLAAAYGMAVTTTMVITTILAGFVARERLGWSVAASVAMTGGLLLVDLAFFGANLFKIAHGGWFPLVVAAVAFTLMTTWRRGREILDRSLRKELLSVDRFLEKVRSDQALRVPGTAIYLSVSPDVIPPALKHNFDHNKVLHERVCLLTVSIKEVPVWPGEKCVELENLQGGFFRIGLHYGYMEEPNVPRALQSVSVPGLSFDAVSTSYFLGKESIIPSHKKPGMAIWREKLFAFLSRNAFSAMPAFCLPPEQSIELRGQVEI